MNAWLGHVSFGPRYVYNYILLIRTFQTWYKSSVELSKQGFRGRCETAIIVGRLRLCFYDGVASNATQT